MIKTFRKKICFDVFVKGLIICILITIYYNYMCFLYQTDIPSVVGKAIEISAGSDLSQYENQKVSCRFDYVMDCIFKFYRKEDPNKEIYTYGYIALDENMKNPVCVFVPPYKNNIMISLQDKTWGIDPTKKGLNHIKSVKVEGFVRKLKDEHLQNYIKEMNSIYGDGYADNVTEVYYIDDENVARGKKSIYIQWGFLFVYCGTLAGVIISLKRGVDCRKYIKSYVIHNGVDLNILVDEFEMADQLTSSFWVSPKYTFFVNGTNVSIIQNRSITRAYKKLWSGGLSMFSVALCTTENKWKYCSMKVQDVAIVLYYYEKKFPHIIIEK